MKTITLDYEEYLKMVAFIDAQTKTIEEFKKDSRVVLIDERYIRFNSSYSWDGRHVPKIVIADEDLAKEYMQKEFDQISKDFEQMADSFKLYMKEYPSDKKSWWK